MSDVDLSKLGQKSVQLPPNVKVFPINIHMLLKMFTSGNKIRVDVLEGFPEDGKIIGVLPDPIGNMGVIVQSKEYSSIVVGSGPQIQDIVLKDVSVEENKGETNQNEDVREKREDVGES